MNDSEFNASDEQAHDDAIRATPAANEPRVEHTVRNVYQAHRTWHGALKDRDRSIPDGEGLKAFEGWIGLILLAGALIGAYELVKPFIH